MNMFIPLLWMLAQSVNSPSGTAIADTPVMRVDQNIVANYSQVAPQIAISGRLRPSNVTALNEAGFKTVIDLRAPNEHWVNRLYHAATKTGLFEYRIMTMPKDAEGMAAFMPELSAVISDEDNYPLLIACASANRASAAWALHQVSVGVPPMTAIKEARATGLTPARENLVREVLGLELLPQ